MSNTIQEHQTKTVEATKLDREITATFTSADASERWLERANPILGGNRPIDCLKRREYERVHAALEALNTGVYI